MPAKGSTYKSGKRNLILDKEFYNEFIKTSKIDIDFKTFKDIILESNQEISNSICQNEEGFKLPENLGYIVVTKYKSKKKPTDWVNTIKLKKKVILTNLHSFGFIHHIKWYKKGLTNFAFRDIYRIEPARLLKRSVAKEVKSGKTYHTWSSNDFLNNNKILKKLQ